MAREQSRDLTLLSGPLDILSHLNSLTSLTVSVSLGLLNSLAKQAEFIRHVYEGF